MSDELWMCEECAEWFIGEETLDSLVCKAIRHNLRTPVPLDVWARWAERWLSGEDRTAAKASEARASCEGVSGMRPLAYAAAAAWEMAWSVDWVAPEAVVALAKLAMAANRFGAKEERP